MAIRKRDERLAPAGYWSPRTVLEEMGRMLDDFRMGFGDMSMRFPGTPLRAIDVRDEENQYVVEAELPGMKKEEVTIEVGEDALTIRPRGRAISRRRRKAICGEKEAVCPSTARSRCQRMPRALRPKQKWKMVFSK